LIDERSNLNYYIKELLDWLNKQDDVLRDAFADKFRKGDFPISSPILGIKPDEMPLKPGFITHYMAPPYTAAFIDWPKLRAMINARHTDLGALMIDKWRRTKLG